MQRVIRLVACYRTQIGVEIVLLLNIASERRFNHMTNCIMFIIMYFLHLLMCILAQGSVKLGPICLLHPLEVFPQRPPENANRVSHKYSQTLVNSVRLFDIRLSINKTILQEKQQFCYVND